MKVFPHHKIHIIPADYAGLEGKELQLAVRKHSSFELLETAALEDLELVVSGIEGQMLNRNVYIMYFGEDQDRPGGIVWDFAAEGHAIELNYLNRVSGDLLEWVYSHIGHQFRVKRVGFYSLDNRITITLHARVPEPADVVKGW